MDVLAPKDIAVAFLMRENAELRKCIAAALVKCDEVFLDSTPAGRTVALEIRQFLESATALQRVSETPESEPLTPT